MPFESARRLVGHIHMRASIAANTLVCSRLHVQVNMALYAATIAMELLSLLRLRHIEPKLHRPFRIPLGVPLLTLICLPQLLLCVVLIGFSLRTLGGVALWAGVMLLSCTASRMTRWYRGRPSVPMTSSQRERWRKDASSRHLS